MPEYTYAVHGLAAGTGPGFSLEAAAVRLADAIGELRDHGELPEHLCTRIEIDPHQRELTVRGWGLSPETDQDRTQSRHVLLTLFELASFHNIIPLHTRTPPLFTLRLLLLDRAERPFAALIGAGIGDTEPVPTGAPWTQPSTPRP